MATPTLPESAATVHTPRSASETADGVRQPLHHRVYVIRLENPLGDGRDGYYVGMTGLTLDERFANHKRGYKSAGVVRKYGVGLAWHLFDGIPAMSVQRSCADRAKPRRRPARSWLPGVRPDQSKARETTEAPHESPACGPRAQPIDVSGLPRWTVSLKNERPTVFP